MHETLTFNELRINIPSMSSYCIICSRGCFSLIFSSQVPQMTNMHKCGIPIQPNISVVYWVRGTHWAAGILFESLEISSTVFPLCNGWSWKPINIFFVCIFSPLKVCNIFIPLHMGLQFCQYSIHLVHSILTLIKVEAFWKAMRNYLLVNSCFFFWFFYIMIHISWGSNVVATGWAFPVILTNYN